jgi:hypothetical protein
MDYKMFPNQEPDGGVEIRCDNMDLCGDIVQALAVDYLGLDYLVRILKVLISKINQIYDN